MDNHMNQYDNGGGYNNGRGNGQNGNGSNGGGQPPRKPSILMLVLAGLSTVLIVFMLWNLLFGSSTGTQSVSYTDFLQYLNEDQVEAVQVQSTGVIIFTLKQQESASEENMPQNGYAFYMSQFPVQYSTVLMEDLDTLTARLEEHGVDGTRVLSDNSGRIMDILVYVVLPVVLMWILLGVIFRKMGGSGGPMGVGKSNAKVYVQKETGVTFKDVAGEDEAKESLVEVVDFLHNPGKYSKIGARLPKGALLVGPPGTGKTLLAKAVAGEAHVPFFSLTGSDFIELYVGVGASRVRDLFKEATKNAPCIIFIDEIDAIGRSRDSKYGGGNEEREQTLNQLLSEMDGFDSSKGILILGATNRPEILDKALLRPGRFDRRIIVDKPDLKGRVEILKVHSKDVKMDETVDLDAIALATSGAVGSDLANMINEAAINAVKEGRQYVNQQDLFNAVEQVLVGKEKKDRIMSKEERKIVSYHEVGHALISALQKNSEPVQKITIVPRTMGALGYVMHVPEEEKYLNTEAELRDMLVGLVGGRAAEEIVFGNVTTGAANDIEKATEIARSMITRYGMSKKFGLMGLATIESQYLEGRAALNCSDQTAAEIDAEVVEILKESYDKALSLLRENRELMDKLAEFLIEKETITGKEFMEIFRREKGLPEPEEKKSGEEDEKSVKEEQKQPKEEPQAAPQEKQPEIPQAAQPSEEGGQEPVEDTKPQETKPEDTKPEGIESQEGKARDANPEETDKPQDKQDPSVGLFSGGKVD
ncbi:MAG TPA: ATP-dependent zinc metalloprotease FtsH [Candidatus Acetatifactor stercoripullorum]|uniref:ATP-dependent zinc metalloprotease FtsH n=1 Tax=Candidatus Acetatifactor stercoripullorum TaxID=2838414 RepID=A0A9D1R3D1_9FIRM|nr:ATP-dependent zinc metalloprotease FtsH [uncultured Acetatifactor sp.]HIW80946.1 ATP-dependent zinc metalloprotease FtsH [Candidatus Acetatifactor stercoripullorum]